MAIVETRMSYLEPWVGKDDEPYVRGKVEESYPRINFTNQEFPVRVNDARPTKNDFNLDTHGFAFHDAPINDEVVEVIRSKEKDGVKNSYYPMVEELVKKHTGASRVIIFDHTYRKKDPSLAPTENPNGREQPATLVHVDQSATGAIGRVRRHAGEDAEALLKGRAQIINVWRPVNGTVEDWPLAVMDYRSIQPSEIHPTSIFKERFEMQGQTVSINHSEAQRWYYLRGQQTTEVTFIKIWDSKDDHDVAKLCPHCAFPDPQAPADAKPRESIEVRCLVFYED
ncbi:methyltransferase [Diaporthe sp. PMI_573]|nr:methyltransferase [Diaporthaceae sp. PMI_573]